MTSNQNNWESIFEAVNQNSGTIEWVRYHLSFHRTIEWVRDNSNGGSPYGMGVAKINGTPVAAAWITDGECEYFDPAELDQKLAEYDETISEVEE